MNKILGTGVLLASLFTANLASAGQIDLVITGFANDAGKARIILMKGQGEYRGESSATRIASVPIRSGVANWTAFDVEPGQYALIAHHDTDSNDELDRPYFELPLEPYGFSNGVWTSAGIPDWEEVAFEVSNEPVPQAIHLRFNAFAALAQMALIGVPSLLAIFGVSALFRRIRQYQTV